MADLLHVDEQNFQTEVMNASEPVLVDFSAVWCQPCKMLDPVVKQLAGEWDGKVKVVKIDADENPNLVMQFGVMGITPPFTLSGAVPAPPVFIDPRTTPGGQGELRHGDPDGPPDMRSLGGAFLFGTKQAGLLAPLLPAIVHVQGSPRLVQLVRMVGEEYEDRKPGSDYLLSRLVEILLVEAMRWTSAVNAPPGLLRGLGDERLARALKRIHADIAHPWTVAALASAAALSRSTFFDRFTRAVGMAPMEYLAAWRMEVAKDLLRQGKHSVAEVAERVGYGSGSAFSVAFSRRVGEPPGRYADRA